MSWYRTMKFCIVSLCLAVGASALHEKVIKAKWASYKARHGKEYHPAHEPTRLNNFLESTVLIETHNARFHRGEVGYELGHNSLSDFTHEEVKSKFLGKRSMNVEGYNFTDVLPMDIQLPKKVDWREHGIVTEPKDQGQCGSCYSFGTVGVIESAIAKATGQKVDLSEQQVIDCTFQTREDLNGGCNGGHEVVVMDYVSKAGLVSEGEYMYVSGRLEESLKCREKPGSWGKNLKYRRVEKGSEDALAEALATYGTLVISVSGENRDFNFYRGGIYDNPNCSKEVDHLISLVGYGTEEGRDYWIIKNSWGAAWGENGFGRLLRGVNQCGIVSDNSWAVHF